MYSTYSSLLNCPCSVSVCLAVCLSILCWCGGIGGGGGRVKQHLLRDDKWGAGQGRTRTRTITNWCALREWHSGGNCGEITIIHDHWPLLLLAIEDVIVCNCIIIIILIYVYIVCVLHRMLYSECVTAFVVSDMANYVSHFLWNQWNYHSYWYKQSQL